MVKFAVPGHSKGVLSKGCDKSVDNGITAQGIAAAAQNMLVAAHAMGLGGFWRTGPLAYDPEVKAAFGIEPADAIVAILYVGSVGVPGKARQMDLESVTRRW